MKRAATQAEVNTVFTARIKALGRPMTVDEAQSLQADLSAEVERDDVPPGALAVGVSLDGREVVINHPDLPRDEHGVAYITFSPGQARHLAKLLLFHADKCIPR